MAFLPLNFTKNWENPKDFPTYEPNEAQVRADLQLLHNETRNWLNRLVEQLNDPTAAAQLPFQPQDGLTAQSVEAAILEVHAAIRNAAAGLLVDGSVSKEKLAAQLLDRTYGGKIWVSMDTPGAAQNPGSDFPVGQLWLRPGFSVDNLAADSWTLSGGMAQTDADGWVLTADGSQAYLSATQTLSGAGQAGQRVFVSLFAAELDDHLSSLTLYLNGKGQDLMPGGGVFETTLDENGVLALVVQGQWPYAEADASFRLQKFAVVNADAAEAALRDCHPLSDWPGLILERMPFSHAELERQVFLQAQPGVWVQVEHEILPVSRGGTGLGQLQYGGLLVGSGAEALKPLAPGGSDTFLGCGDGGPAWVGAEEMVQIMGALRFASGSYVGQASMDDRTVKLPVTPKLLYICSRDNAEEITVGIVPQERIILMQESIGTQVYDFIDEENKDWEFASSVQLVGNQLKFTSENRQVLPRYDNRYGNQTGIIYEWAAIY